MLGDRLGVGLRPGEAIELGQRPPTLDPSGIEAGGDLERGDGARAVLEARPVDLAEAVPQRDQRGSFVRRQLAAEALDLAAIDALLRLPVVRLRHQLVDALEGLEVVRIGVKGLLERFNRFSPRVKLLGQDVAGGDEVGPARRVVRQLGQAGQQLDRLLPLLGVGVELEQPVHDRALVRPDLERLQIGRDRPLRVVSPLAVDRRHVLEQPQLGPRIVGDRQQRLGVAHDRVVVARGARRLDQRLQRAGAARIERQRLLQRFDRLGRRAGAQPGDAEPLVGDDLRLARQPLGIGEHALRRRWQPRSTPARRNVRSARSLRAASVAADGAAGEELSAAAAARKASSAPASSPVASRARPSRWKRRARSGAGSPSALLARSSASGSSPAKSPRRSLISASFSTRSVRVPSSARISAYRSAACTSSSSAVAQISAASPRMRVLSPTSVTTAAARPSSCRAFNQSFRSR